MRAAAGASLDQRAYTGLVLVFVMAGLTITGMLFLPTLTSKTVQRNNTAEEVMLARLEEGFGDYTRIFQIIPGTGTWATAIASVNSLNVTQVNCVLPAFNSDATIQRVFVVDDYLGGGSPLLPYAQSTNGLTGTQTNLLNARARAMIVSSTKRGLALPVSTGFVSQTNFDAIWNWTYNPATEAPPSGWSAAWTGNGEFLHVKPFYLPNLFSKITLQNVMYGIGASNYTTTTVSSQTDYYFLNGTRMALATTSGTLKQHHVVRNDASFSFATSSTLPLVWFKFEEASGTLATNLGSLSSAANGTISSGVNYRRNGPRPPSFPLFSSSNYAMRFNDPNEYVTTTNSVLNNMTAFTLGVWVNVADLPNDRVGLIGQNDAIELGFITTSSVQLWTPSGGSVTVSWPYGYGAWHHIAATGDGAALKLYFDGALVGTTSYATTNYGSSSYTFNVGSAVTFDAPVSSSDIDATFDEVVAYDRALSASEILSLSTGAIP